MLKKVRLYSLLTIIVASVVVGLFSFSQIATAQTTPPTTDPTATDPATTDTTPWIDDAVLQDANTVTFTHVVSYCMEGTSKSAPGDNNGTDIAPTQNDIRDGNWFNNFKNNSTFTDNPYAYNSYAVPVGYGIQGAGSDGRVSCKDDHVNVAKSFMSLAGWSDSKVAACDIGFRMEGHGGDNRDTAAQCASFDANNSGKKYLGQMRNERGDNTQPPDAHLLSILPRGANKTGGYGYNDIQMHVLYELAFTQACGATIVGPADPGSGYQKTTIVNKEGKAVEVDYKMPDGGKTVPVAYENKIKCQDLADLMKKTADAYAAWITQNGTTGSAATGSGDGAGKSTCTVEGVGWIVCPVVKLMAKVVDAAYSYVAGLLAVQPLMMTGSDCNGQTTCIYQAWSIMRNFANVAFVIAFLFIIFSQLTSFGISNYGIKRMLPRLIVAAVLVNASFWICAAAVDLSNITGSSIRGIFDSIQASLAMPVAQNITGAADTGTGWTGIAGFVLALTGASIALLYIGLSALLPALLVALAAIVTVFIVLTLRQALVILLIVVSPLAFVAYLLPNTESYFKKWRELLQVLLLMYPIISFIFGASALASQIVMQTAPNNDLKLPIQIMGALISIIPLAITPLVMKTAGGLLNRFGGIVNNPNKGLFDRANKGAESYRKRAEGRREIRALSGGPTFGRGRFKRRAERAAEEAGIQNNVKHAQTEYLADKSREDAGFRNRLAGGSNLPVTGTTIISASPKALDRAESNAISAQKAAEAEEIKNAQTKISANIAPGDMATLGTIMANAIRNGDSITARAAQNELLTGGNPGIAQYRQTMTDIENETVPGGPTGSMNIMSSDAVTAMRGNVLHNHGGIKASAADITNQAANGGAMSASTNDGNLWRNMSTEEFAGQKSSSQQQAINSGAFVGHEELLHDVLTNPNVAKNVNKSILTQLTNIANASAHPLPSPGGRPSPAPTPAATRNPDFTTTHLTAPVAAGGWGPQKIQVEVANRGGIQVLHNDEVIDIATAHATHQVGQRALEERGRRHI